LLDKLPKEYANILPTAEDFANRIKLPEELETEEAARESRAKDA